MCLKTWGDKQQQQQQQQGKCRFCTQFDEKVGHISACPILAN